jgi:alkylation response protein AidB-like acyl-CoA dehydrogenase
MRDLVRTFLEKEVKPRVPECDAKGETPLDLVQKGFDMGLHLISVPEEYGGLGLGLRTQIIVSEELSRIDLGFATAFNSLGLKCVLAMGNEEQKARACEIVIPGRMSSFCLTEPEAGSDAGSLRTTAVRDGDNYIINGSKCFITCGAYAGLYIIMAVTDKSKGAKGISAFMVEAGTPGLIIGKDENKMGIRLSNTCSLTFEDMVVPAKNMLGEEGSGYVNALKALNLGRISIASSATGIAQRALEEAVAYSRQRKAFGQYIGDFQGVQFMLADMATKIEASRQMVQHAVDLYEAGKPYIKAASMAKYFASDCAMQVTTDAVQIFGGYGYSKEYPVEKLMRDAKVTQIVEGSNQVQRMIVGRMLAKDGGAADYLLVD